MYLHHVQVQSPCNQAQGIVTRPPYQTPKFDDVGDDHDGAVEENQLWTLL